MIDSHTSKFGYTEISPPLLVRDDAMFGTNQLPKFRDDQFSAGPEHWLIPTAEVPLTNLVRESILSEEELPLRFTAFTPCFRQERALRGAIPGGSSACISSPRWRWSASRRRRPRRTSTNA